MYFQLQLLTAMRHHSDNPSLGILFLFVLWLLVASGHRRIFSSAALVLYTINGLKCHRGLPPCLEQKGCNLKRGGTGRQGRADAKEKMIFYRIKKKRRPQLVS